MTPIAHNNDTIGKQRLSNHNNFKIAGFVCLALIILMTSLYFTVISKVFPQEKYPFPLALTAFFVVILIIFFFVFIWKYIKGEELICRTLFINFARQFGTDENSLRTLEKPEYGRRRIPGIWASVPVCYKNRNFIFAAENIEVSNGHGCLPYFSISTKQAGQMRGQKNDVHLHLDPKSRETVENIQKRLKHVILLCDNNDLSCKIMMTPKVTIMDLHIMMDTLLSIE